MDRTSILGDTIDYMKELLQKITDLQHEMGLDDPQLPYALDILKDMKANDMFVRNTPKVNSNLPTLPSQQSSNGHLELVT